MAVGLLCVFWLDFTKGLTNSEFVMHSAFHLVFVSPIWTAVKTIFLFTVVDLEEVP